MKKTTSPSPASSASSSIPAAINRDRNGQNANSYTNHESISRRSYELWQEAGCPNGCETEFWLTAEQQLGDVASANRSKQP